MADKIDMPELKVRVEQLRPGMYIRLTDINWSRHPFLRSSFKIKSKAQIEALISYEINEVKYVPSLSEVDPRKFVKPRGRGEKTNIPDATGSGEKKKTDRLKQVAKKRQLKAAKEAEMASTRKMFLGIADILNEINQHTEVLERAFKNTDDPQKFMAAATKVATRIAKKAPGGDSALVYALNIRRPLKNLARHSVNVSYLSTMIAKELGIKKPKVEEISLGALLHDVGLVLQDARHLKDRRGLNWSKPANRAAHPLVGREYLFKVNGTSCEVKNIIFKHKERLDGSGQPNRIDGDDFDVCSEIVALANLYENFCDGFSDFDDLPQMTPFQAVAYLYYKQKGSAFRTNTVEALCDVLGPTPPGTTIRLTDGGIGVVVANNPEDYETPYIVLYNDHAKVFERVVLPLGKNRDIKILDSIRFDTLSKEVQNYFCAPDTWGAGDF